MLRCVQLSCGPVVSCFSSMYVPWGLLAVVRWSSLPFSLPSPCLAAQLQTVFSYRTSMCLAAHLLTCHACICLRAHLQAEFSYMHPPTLIAVVYTTAVAHEAGQQARQRGGAGGCGRSGWRRSQRCVKHSAEGDLRPLAQPCAFCVFATHLRFPPTSFRELLYTQLKVAWAGQLGLVHICTSAVIQLFSKCCVPGTSDCLLECSPCRDKLHVLKCACE